jgi:hypothetical protein
MKNTWYNKGRIMDNYKCFHCQLPNHTFKNCSEATCACPCVQELHSFPKNQQADEISSFAPHFLHIKAEEIPGLLYPYKQISRFMKVRVKEQIVGKIDRRLKEEIY